MKPDRRDVLKYLGYKGNEPDERTGALIDRCLPALEHAARPAHVLLKLPVTVEESSVSLPGLDIESRYLSRHMKNCVSAAVFAATLGAGVDRLMQAYSKTDMPAAVVLQACAAALLEFFCDEIQSEVSKECSKEGLLIRPRFSPGYGDFSLACQPGILKLLDAPKKIALSCTEAYMLTPTKSVTAIIGLYPGKL